MPVDKNHPFFLGGASMPFQQPNLVSPSAWLNFRDFVFITWNLQKPSRKVKAKYDPSTLEHQKLINLKPTGRWKRMLLVHSITIFFMDGLHHFKSPQASRVRVVKSAVAGGWRRGGGAFKAKAPLGKRERTPRGWATVRNRPKNLKLEDEKSSMKNCSSYYLVIMKVRTRPNELSLWLMVDGWWLTDVFFYHSTSFMVTAIWVIPSNL